MLNTNIPQNVNDLIIRLVNKSTIDLHSDVSTAFLNVGTIHWYNLPSKLNNLLDVIKLYQTYLLDGDLQDLIDETGLIRWYNIFNSVSLVDKMTNLIEQL